jgi:cytochrome c biogenesis protein CcmG/thiol:disulfide interchange protein DsbE
MTDAAQQTHAVDEEVAAVLARAGRRRGPRLRWIGVGVAVTLITVLGVAVGRGLGRDATLVRSPLLGKPAPSFQLPGLGGGEVASSDYAGEIVVVNFWASWCVPCRQEAPELQAFAQRWDGQGVNVVGVVYNDSEAEATAFRDQYGLTYPQAMDPDGRTAIDFGVFGVPETYVIDGRGIVMAKLIGAVQRGTLDQVVSAVTAGETVTEQNDRYRTSPADQ